MNTVLKDTVVMLFFKNIIFLGGGAGGSGGQVHGVSRSSISVFYA